MDSSRSDGLSRPSHAPSKQAIARHQGPDLRRGLWQLANTFIPYLILRYLMVQSVTVSYWLTLALAVPAVGFLLRIFIFFHHCGSQGAAEDI